MRIVLLALLLGGSLALPARLDAQTQGTQQHRDHGKAAVHPQSHPCPQPGARHAPGDHQKQSDHRKHGEGHGQPGHAGMGHPTQAGACAGPVDSTFAALQERGKVAMGVDQYTSTHLFDALPDGGRIELQRDADDPEGVAVIRAHLQDIVKAFTSGDFRIPFFVHDREVPGTRVMAAKREAIAYSFRELPRGGEIRITTRDPEALRAIHEFMAFQRMDHRAGGKAGHH